MVWIKICGVTTPSDAEAAIAEGADAVGLNFYPKSKRYVTEPQAAAIVQALPAAATTVGVFVNALDTEMTRVVKKLGLRAAQSYHDVFQDVDAGYIAAFRVQDEQSLDLIHDFIYTAGAWRLPDAVLVDSYVPGEMGGTGHRAPWELIAAARLIVPVILAGGLTPENVAEAIRTVRPAGVDVASGVESAPGVKDRVRMRDFVQAAREAASSLGGPPLGFRLSGDAGLE